MIDSLLIKHFKCFKHLNLPLRRLTLLTGLNSAGKSSVIQALLTVHQSLQLPGPPPQLLLNGDFVSLGSVHDVVDRLTGRESFSIGISTGESRIRWDFDATDRTSLVAPLARSVFSPTGGENLRNWYPKHESDSVKAGMSELSQLLYVSTERIGPRDTYDADYNEWQGDRLGSRGEYTPWFLLRHEGMEVPLSLRIGDGPPQLLRQVELWMDKFFPGADLRISKVAVPGPPPIELPLVSVGLRTSAEDAFYRPQNVGYGLSHVLPILVGGLAAAKGRMFIVENPEAHLHPGAQSEMAHFLAAVAKAGAQVIIESHSDHILNGIRRAVKEGLLQPDEVAIHYFEGRDLKTYETKLVSPEIKPGGQIVDWPKGFFDQINRDLAELVSWD